MNQTIFFRVDVNSQIGSGHLQRCLALASEFNSNNWRVTFLLKKNSSAFTPLIPNWVEVLMFDESLTEAAIAETLPDFEIGVVDHYFLNAEHEQALFKKCTVSLTIDDLANRTHAGHFLLDQNFYKNAEKRYQEKVLPMTNLLLGPNYALLRKEFTEQSISRGRVPPKFFVCLGGTDLTGEILKVAEALILARQESLFFEADFVVGKNFLYVDQLRELIVRLSGSKLHIQATNIAQMMGESDLALGAGGTMTWERAASGIPSICFCIADNQIELAQTFADEGCHITLGNAANVTALVILKSVKDYFKNKEKFEAMGAKSKTYCDGHGAKRVFTLLTQTLLKA